MLHVLLIGDVLAPGRAVALAVHLEHREVGHEAVGSGAVPVLFIGLEEDAIAGTDDLDRPATMLAPANTLGDVDGLPVGAGVPGIVVGGQIELVARSTDFQWPDTIAMSPDGDLHRSNTQFHLLPDFNGRGQAHAAVQDLPAEAFVVVRSRPHSSRAQQCYGSKGVLKDSAKHVPIDATAAADLAETIPLLAKLVAPVVEQVAQRLVQGQSRTSKPI